MDAGRFICLLAQDGSPVGLAIPKGLSSLLMAAGIVLLLIVMIGHAKKTRRNTNPVLTMHPDERIKAVRDEAHASVSVADRRTAEAAEVTRQLTALLDNRSQKLEILIQHADERISRLERLASEAEGRLTPRHTSTPAASDTSYANDALKQQIYDLADQGKKAVEIAQRLGQHAGKVELILALRRA